MINAKEIRIGLVESPPYVNLEDDIASGPLVEYLVMMFEGQEYQLNLQVLPTKRGGRELAKGAIDILLPVSKDQHELFIANKPIFHSVPGLCFKKENFIPFLSTTSRYSELSIGVPAGANLAESLANKMKKVSFIEGMDVLDRGIQLLLRNRIDALFHPSPINVYHFTNPLSKDIACSYFYGYSSGQYIAYSSNIETEKLDYLNGHFQALMEEQSFEYFFATYMQKQRK